MQANGGAAAARPRRSNLAVPGSNPRFLEKAKGLPADQVFLDLEDACAPLAKPAARKNIVAALNEGGWGEKIRVVRVNDWTTHWTYRDVVEVVEGAGANLDCIMLPKVQGPEQVITLDTLLTQVEKTMGFEVGRIGIEAQIENAQGLIAVDAIAKASRRLETIIFGPADFMASINMKSLVVGEQPPGYDRGDAYHHVLMSILMAARANGKQAIDGPYLQIRDPDGFRRVASRSAALGFDGKWVLHPDQVGIANEVYAPRQEDYDHAELILDAYDFYTSAAGGEGLGNAWRRDDRRGIPQNGSGDLRQGPGRRPRPDIRIQPAGGLMAVHEARLGRFYEDFEPGDVYQHPIGRTISEADCTWFTQLTCNTNQNHFNHHLAASNPVTGGRVIVNSGLTVAIVLGLSVLDMSQNAVANLGWTDIRLTHPVYIGDTLYAESVCTAKRESSHRAGMGIVSMFTRGLNQDGDTVLSWKRTVMVPRSGQGIGEHYFPVAKAGPLQPGDHPGPDGS
jgi:citrate lyase subunit beta / citryl-CoA lyase